MSDSSKTGKQTEKAKGGKGKAKASSDEKEVKPRQTKTPPMTPEEYSQMIAEGSLSWNKVTSPFTGSQKSRFNMPDNAPTKDEYKAVTDLLHASEKEYKALWNSKKEKKKAKDADETKDTKKNTGFSRPAFFPARAATILNNEFNLPENLKFKFYPEVGGDSLGTSASVLQLALGYIHEKGLKDKKTKLITCDKNLNDLFESHIDKLEGKVWSRNDQGQLQFPHKTLQALCPKLFDTIRVPDKMLSEDEMNRINARGVFLTGRTKANNALKAKHERVAKTKAAAEKAAAAAEQAAKEEDLEKIAVEKAKQAAAEKASLIAAGK